MLYVPCADVLHGDSALQEAFHAHSGPAIMAYVIWSILSIYHTVMCMVPSCERTIDESRDGVILVLFALVGVKDR